MRVEVFDDSAEDPPDLRLSYTTSQSQEFGKALNLAPSAEDRHKVVEALLETLKTLGHQV